MTSKTKSKLINSDIKTLFKRAGIDGVTQIKALDTGEYNAVCQVTAAEKEYVIKIAPPPGLPVLRYEQNLMSSELAWYEKVAAHTSITLPHIHFLDLTATAAHSGYFIMDRLPGRALNEMKLSVTEKKNATSAMAEMAAQIHKIKNDKFGYIQTGLHSNWHQAIRAMTSNIINDAKKVNKPLKDGLELLAHIDRHQETLEAAECTMVNFDIHSANVIANANNYAMVDLERSFWGDPVAELVNLEMMLPLEEKTISIAAYNKLADTPIELTKETKIRYAIALGYLGLIMGTERFYRYTRLNSGWWRNKLAQRIFLKRAFKSL